MEVLFAAVLVGIGVLAIFLKLTTPERPPAPPRRPRPPEHPSGKSMPGGEWDVFVPNRMPGNQLQSERGSSAPPKAS